jgi:diphthine-ammonia ligase
MTKNALCSWSGGKDSCYALIQAITQGFQPAVLLNVLNEEGQISRSHGIPKAILEAQSRLAKIPIKTVSSSWNDYERVFTQTLTELKSQYELSYAVFGDIDLQPHRDWEEKVCANAGLGAFLPLWQKDRRGLVNQMLDLGIETIIVSCNETMGPEFLGRKLTPELVEKLDSMGIDPCGENGEFHTLVLDCPLFSGPLRVDIGKKVLHEKYWFLELISGY